MTEDQELNNLADERQSGPFIPVSLEDLDFFGPAVPMTQEMFDRVAELIDGVYVDLNGSLEPTSNLREAFTRHRDTFKDYDSNG